jgi:hypothetical protein
LRIWARLILCLFFVPCISRAGAQALPTATQALRISAFGGFTGSDFGLGASRNLGATAGVDIGVGGFHGVHPAVEVRGTYAVDGHVVASDKSVLGGIRLGHPFGRIHPYFDFLYGRGILDYGGAGYTNSTYTLIYTHTAGNVMSPGGGFDLSLSERFAVKVDYQYQRFATPVIPAQHITVTPITFGVAYKFNFNHHPRYDKRAP